MEVEHRDTPSHAHAHTTLAMTCARRGRETERASREGRREQEQHVARALLLLSLSLRSASYRVPLRVLRILSTSESWGTCPTLRPLCLVRGAAGPLGARTRVTRCAARLGSAGRALGRGRARNRNSGASSLGLAVAEMGSARERLVRPRQRHQAQRHQAQRVARHIGARGHGCRAGCCSHHDLTTVARPAERHLRLVGSLCSKLGG